jgi:hypothetical protein
MWACIDSGALTARPYPALPACSSAHRGVVHPVFTGQHAAGACLLAGPRARGAEVQRRARGEEVAELRRRGLELGEQRGGRRVGLKQAGVHGTGREHLDGRAEHHLLRRHGRVHGGHGSGRAGRAGQRQHRASAGPVGAKQGPQAPARGTRQRHDATNGAHWDTDGAKAGGQGRGGPGREAGHCVGGDGERRGQASWRLEAIE